MCVGVQRTKPVCVSLSRQRVCVCCSGPGPYDLAVVIFSFGGNYMIERVGVLSLSLVDSGNGEGKGRKRKLMESKVFFLLS